MSKHKKGRVGTRIDMTPLVDVVMLLLTFFMMTTVFKPPEEVMVELPASHSNFKLPELDVMMIYVNKSGEIYIGVDSQHLMGRLFGQENRFKKAVQMNKEQLGNILIQARINNPKLRTVIKGDKGAPFGPLEDVMDVLQKARITRFNLVTDLDKGA
ncbi:MAG: biopolymer transporter ExbD [Bacteroidetes bacterium]|jgi:biopolymer transport protein ExbD|nr:biopolymer transporter ExbD [Bacteroidota bacterium]